MNTRLKQFIAAENITQAQLADNLNVVRASVSHILAGRNKPGYDFICGLMSHYPNLNIEWLMFGKGKMYKTQEQQTIFDTNLQENEEKDQRRTVIALKMNNGHGNKRMRQHQADVPERV